MGFALIKLSSCLTVVKRSSDFSFVRIFLERTVSCVEINQVNSRPMMV